MGGGKHTRDRHCVVPRPPPSLSTNRLEPLDLVTLPFPFVPLFFLSPRIPFLPRNSRNVLQILERQERRGATQYNASLGTTHTTQAKTLSASSKTARRATYQEKKKTHLLLLLFSCSYLCRRRAVLLMGMDKMTLKLKTATSLVVSALLGSPTAEAFAPSFAIRGAPPRVLSRGELGNQTHTHIQYATGC